MGVMASSSEGAVSQYTELDQDGSSVLHVGVSSFTDAWGLDIYGMTERVSSCVFCHSWMLNIMWGTDLYRLHEFALRLHHMFCMAVACRPR